MTIAFGNILAPTIGGWLVDHRAGLAGSGNCAALCLKYPTDCGTTGTIPISGPYPYPCPTTPFDCTPWEW